MKEFRIELAMQMIAATTPESIRGTHIKINRAEQGE
jgi:hypothetical protein